MAAHNAAHIVDHVTGHDHASEAKLRFGDPTRKRRLVGQLCSQIPSTAPSSRSGRTHGGCEDRPRVRTAGSPGGEWYIDRRGRFCSFWSPSYRACSVLQWIVVDAVIVGVRFIGSDYGAQFDGRYQHRL